MHLTKSFLIIMMVIGLSFSSIHEIPIQSRVVTLIIPYGARSGAMGEVGTALCDDESVMFYNPAGLGLYNEKFQNGFGSFFWEPLLPTFGLRELWHSSISGIIQFPDHPSIGGIGLNWNHLSNGFLRTYDVLGRFSTSTTNSESVLSINWGVNLKEIGVKNQYLGIAFKYYESTTMPNYDIDETSAHGIAFDLGYLWNPVKKLNVGLNFQNIGPRVEYNSIRNLYSLPFTLNTAIAFKKSIVQDGIRFFDFSSEFRLSKELVTYNFKRGKPDPFWVALSKDWTVDGLKDIQYNFGIETKFMNILSIQNGMLVDPVNERFESTFGIGLHAFNHFRFSWSYIHAPEGYLVSVSEWFDNQRLGANGARNEQWRISLACERLGIWDRSDRQWWKVRN